MKRIKDALANLYLIGALTLAVVPWLATGSVSQEEDLFCNRWEPEAEIYCTEKPANCLCEIIVYPED